MCMYMYIFIIVWLAIAHNYTMYMYYMFMCPPLSTHSVSETVIPDFEVGRAESVGSTILCNPRTPITEPWLCTAICGPSPMLNTLTVSASVSAEAGPSATIQLPLLTDRTYYCVVNATTDDDTVTVLRGRLAFNLSGKFLVCHAQTFS